MATKADYVKFHKIRADYIKARDEWADQESALRVKYGPGFNKVWASAGERKKLDTLASKGDKLGNKMIELLWRVSPRDWTYGVSFDWVMRELSWEDAITNGPLSVTPQASYGTSAHWMEKLREKPNKPNQSGFSRHQR